MTECPVCDAQDAEGGPVRGYDLLHVNWHCKNDLQLITPEIEPFLHGYIADYCKKDPEVFFVEVGGTEDHVHLIVEVMPTITIGERVGKVKGASSHDVNKHVGAGSRIAPHHLFRHHTHHGANDINHPGNAVRSASCCSSPFPRS